MKIEAKIQQEIVVWFNNNYCLQKNDPKCVVFSVPNETKDVKEMMVKKATGLLSGVSDLIVVLPSKVLFVEVKTTTGKQSKNQIKFQKEVTDLGFEYHLVRSLDDFKKIVLYLQLKQ